jgi:hypothetical protein
MKQIWLKQLNLILYPRSKLTNKELMIKWNSRDKTLMNNFMDRAFLVAHRSSFKIRAQEVTSIKFLIILKISLNLPIGIYK